jgi:hypothetical protein
MWGDGRLRVVGSKPILTLFSKPSEVKKVFSLHVQQEISFSSSSGNVLIPKKAAYRWS